MYAKNLAVTVSYLSYSLAGPARARGAPPPASVFGIQNLADCLVCEGSGCDCLICEVSDLDCLIYMKNLEVTVLYVPKPWL